MTGRLVTGQLDARHRVAVGLERRYLAVEAMILIAFEAKVNEKSVGTVFFRGGDWFVRHRDDAFVMLTSALGDQLFQPGRESRD